MLFRSKCFLFAFLFMLSFTSYAEQKNLTEEMLTVTDKNGNEFYLYMNKNEVIEKLGEPDKISFTTNYPNDKYNIVAIEYSEGIVFNYRKGFEKIFLLEISKPIFYISSSKIKVSMNLKEVQNIYGEQYSSSKVYITSEIDNTKILRIVYETNDQKIISNDIDPEDKEGCTYSVQFFFDNNTKKLILFQLFADFGV